MHWGGDDESFEAQMEVDGDRHATPLPKGGDKFRKGPW